MVFNSIVPSEMTTAELRQMCGDLFTAKNWKLKHATVKLANGLDYKVPVERLAEYQQAESESRA